MTKKERRVEAMLCIHHLGSLAKDWDGYFTGHYDPRVLIEHVANRRHAVKVLKKAIRKAYGRA